MYYIVYVDGVVVEWTRRSNDEEAIAYAEKNWPTQSISVTRVENKRKRV